MNLSRKLIASTMVLFSMLVSGCSKGAKMDQLSSDVQSLNSKVDQISNDVNNIHSDVKITKDDAARANQRLDNQISSYHK